MPFAACPKNSARQDWSCSNYRRERLRKGWRFGKPRAAAKDCVVRVFVSSTFREMMRERDLLVKQVFPELRCKCAKRFVTFAEVDLRFLSRRQI